MTHVPPKNIPTDHSSSVVNEPVPQRFPEQADAPAGMRALLESERRAQETFGATRRRAYVEIPRYLDHLDVHVEEEGLPLVVTGDPGSGKSALIAYWSHRYRSTHPEAFIITHHVGVAASGGDHHALLLRIMAEIRERYAIEDPLPTDTREIEQGFTHWLGHVQRERLVIAIDALNQLDEESQALGWLPEYVQPNIRLVLTTNGGDTLHQLRGRALPEFHVQPLTLRQRNEMMRRYLDDFGRRFRTEQLERVSGDSSSANPLFLRTRLEELRRHTAGSDANELIDYYLEARDLDELFQRVLMRLEREHGTEIVAGAMTLLWGSRRGLHAEELQAMAGTSHVPLAALLRGLEFHLMNRDGLLAFFHDQFREAVGNRYLASGDTAMAAELHLRIARHFSAQPVSPRRAEEEPWQLLRAGAWDMLRDCISSLPMFMELHGSGGPHTLISYWLALGDRHDPVASYLEQLEAGTADAHDPVLFTLGTFFSACGRYEDAETLARRSLALREDLHGADHPDVAESLDTLATILYHTRDTHEAMGLARRALAIRMHCLGESHPTIAKNMAALGAILYGAGSFEEAQAVLEQALAISEGAGRGRHPVTATILNNLGAIRIATGRPASAVTYIERAMEINERLLGPEHPEVAANLVNIAFALQQQGDTKGAERYYLRALPIYEKALGAQHPETAVILTNLGLLYNKLERQDDAEGLFRRALRIRMHALGAMHVETLQSMFRLGNVVSAQGSSDEATDLYERSLCGLQELLGQGNPELLRMRAHVAERMHTLQMESRSVSASNEADTEHEAGTVRATHA